MQAIPKPIIKWVGGKTQIIDKLLPYFPSVINNYHEIFLGGGSVLFAVLSYVKHERIVLHGNIYAYDINEPLIYMYKNIQTNPHALYREIRAIIDEFYECGGSVDKPNRAPKTKSEAKESRETYYYWIRSEYNKLEDKRSLTASAMFIFLNKTCFRGVFRMGPRGFNVPYGHYQHPEIVNWKHLEEIHELIQPVVFECCDFRVSIPRVGLCDFVYLDPPYVPEKATSFVGYTENGFNQHTELFQLMNGMDEKGVQFVMSNADVPLVRNIFTDTKYSMVPVLCKRAIHSKNPTATAGELIITNR